MSWVGCAVAIRGCSVTRVCARVAHCSGPSLKQDYQFFEMQNVDVYELMCSVLGLEPAPNNGTLSRVQHLFR